MAFAVINKKLFITKAPKFRKLCTKCEEARNGLILGVYEGCDEEPVLTDVSAKFNEEVGGKLLHLIKETKLDLGYGHARRFHNLHDEFAAVAVVALGRQNMGYNELEAIHEGMEAVRVASGMGSRILEREGVTKIHIDDLGYAEQAAEGAVLALWKYQEYKNEADWKVIPSVELYSCDTSDMDSFQRGIFKAESQNWVRQICETPPNIMTPLRFAQEAVSELCPCGVKVEVHDKDWIEHNNLQAFMSVYKGSCEPPIFLEVSHCGGHMDQMPIALVGKGITYDSGGLCIKPCREQFRTKADINGAATILGAMRIASALSLPINIIAVLPICEYTTSGMSMKCGDIVNGLNGKSIKVTTADRDGRVAMSDALVYVQKAHEPRLIIDVATLGTKRNDGIVGSGASGVYSNSQTMWGQTRKAGIITGDRVWRFPLWKYYNEKVTNYTSHDVDNTGAGHGSSPLAAAFLSEFIKCVDWIHFDTTGTGKDMDNKVYPYYTKGLSSGRPTRTLAQLLTQLACPMEGSRRLS